MIFPSSIGDLSISIKGDSEIVRAQIDEIIALSESRGFLIKRITSSEIVIVDPNTRLIEELGKLPIDPKKTSIEIMLLQK